MSPFWKSFLLVAIPIIIFSVVSTPGDIDNSQIGVLWFIGLLIWIVAAIIMVVAFVRGASQTGLGILAALAVGSIALALTCFSNVSELTF